MGRRNSHESYVEGPTRIEEEKPDHRKQDGTLLGWTETTSLSIGAEKTGRSNRCPLDLETRKVLVSWRSLRAAIAKLFSTWAWFCGRRYFHGLAWCWWVGWFLDDSRPLPLLCTLAHLLLLIHCDTMVMGVMGRSCKHRWSFTHLPMLTSCCATQLLTPQTSIGPWSALGDHCFRELKSHCGRVRSGWEVRGQKGTVTRSFKEMHVEGKDERAVVVISSVLLCFLTWGRLDTVDTPHAKEKALVERRAEDKSKDLC